MGEKSTINSVVVEEMCVEVLTCEPAEPHEAGNIESSKTNPIEKVTYKLGGKYCIARWCNNSRRTNQNVTLFRLPVKDKDRAFQWLRNASREDLIGNSMKYLHALRLCDEHFTDDMFMNITRKRLNCKAIPKLFSKPEIIQQLDDKRLRKQLDCDPIGSPRPHGRQPRAILPKVVALSMSPAILKNTQSEADMLNNSPHRLNLFGHLEAESRGDKSVNTSATKDFNNVLVGAFNIPSKHIEIDSESVLCYSVDKDQTFSETESVCNDHSFQKWDDTVYPCPSCGEMFLVRSNLVRHQTTFHSERSVQCDSCGVVVISKSEFLEHVCTGSTNYSHQDRESMLEIIT